MARDAFEECLARVLRSEGGYSDHPRDPGGPTNLGITLSEFRRHARAAATLADLRAMTRAQAAAIYRARYWDVLGCDGLPAGVDYCVFDYGVNSGVGRAGKVLRRTLGLSDDTSEVTPAVISACARTHAGTLISAICEERMRFLRRLSIWPTFGTGWQRRVAEVRTAALAMAHGVSRAPAGGARPAPPSGKAATPLNTAARGACASGTLAAGAAGAQQAHAHDAGTIVLLAVVALTVALFLGGWFYWRWRQRRQQEKA
ncbi:MAG: glycoside hydrolase family 108 protein [Proteobacteria bacterium]|nr:glycoside hydrolase family 108 protein [Pseudomonadota bacterium]